MMSLLTSLLLAVQHLPNAFYLQCKIKERTSMTAPQTFLAAVYAITNKAEYGFVCSEEPAIIEAVIEAAEMPFNGESYAEVKNRLSSMLGALNKIGVEITCNGSFLTIWGPGVKRG